MTQIAISTEFIKLDAFLKFASAVCSGGEAKIIIAEGMVQVNGEVCTMRGKKLVEGDIVSFNGEDFEIAKEYLNKLGKEVKFYDGVLYAQKNPFLNCNLEEIEENTSVILE